MKPTKTRGHTTDFTKPEGWDDAECGTLSVRREQIGDRVYHYSTWAPTKEEVQRLIDGCCIELCCIGVQTPVAMHVVEPLHVVGETK